MHAYHLVARHGEHAEWIVVAEVSFECERKVREVVERLHTVRRDTCRVERFAKMWNLGVGALQRLLQSIELQRRELGARHAFGAAIEHECSIADCSWRRHNLTSVGAVSWQNPSRFNHRPGDARAAYRYVAKGEALIVSGPRDQNELERPAGREGGQPGASECKRSGSLDKHAKRDTGQRKYQAKGKEPHRQESERKKHAGDPGFAAQPRSLCSTSDAVVERGEPARTNSVTDESARRGPDDGRAVGSLAKASSASCTSGW